MIVFERNETEKELRRFELTTREIEIFVWLTKGKTDKEIAFLCYISPRTVQNHLYRIYDKLGVENRTSAVLRLVNFNF